MQANPANNQEIADPVIERIRHDTRRRELTIARVERLTPCMIRVVAQGDELAGFASAAPDDHIKIFVPGADGATQMRDYTPRHFDAARGELLIDFADHDGGPITDWARQAKAGDRLVVGGPRGSQVVTGGIDRWVLIGDETALPAIGRRIEELGAGVEVTSLVAVPTRADEQVFKTAVSLDARWVHRPASAATDAVFLLDALKRIELPPRTYVWAAAEAGVARALRRYLIEERGVSKAWLKVAGYWVQGEADASVKNLEG